MNKQATSNPDQSKPSSMVFIKSVIISGFKTYKNRTVIENFSPHHNVVIGSNGSGKSNFFAAIRFVLSEEHTNLKRDERKGFIYQGTGQVMSAFVEIIFDDPDNIMLAPLNNDSGEVRVRRTVGLKKDEYMINDKNSTRQDVRRILENIGFTTTNPYNIVPQGKIISLTNAKDFERLQLLEDVIGAKSFDKKLQDSLKKMESTERDRLKITDELSELETKLNELSEEREELEEYNRLNRDRKVLQFSLYDNELNEITDQIEKFDSEYNTIVNSSSEYVSELEKREALANQLEKRILAVNSELKIKESNEVPEARFSSVEISKKIAGLDVKIAELEAILKNSNEQLQDDMESLEDVKRQVTAKMKELSEMDPKNCHLSEKIRSLNLRLSNLNQRQRDLLEKRGKYSNFQSIAVRNKWIENAITGVNSAISETLQTRAALEEQYKNFEKELDHLDIDKVEITNAIEGVTVKSELSNVLQKLNRFKSEYMTKIDERKQSWRVEQKLQTVLETLETDIKRAESKVNETIDRTTSLGLENVNKIVNNLGLRDRVFGPLGELIKVSEKYKTCAEIVSGTSLFHIVVDNENTASILIKELFATRGGRVTFIPLDKLSLDPNIVYPANSEENQCTPLIKKIKFDPMFQHVVQHVFGKTIVVRSLAQGIQLAKDFKLNAITLDGDRADKKGVISGGYNDHYKMMRIDSLRELKGCKKEYRKSEAQLDAVRLSLRDLDKEIDSLNASIKQCIAKKDSLETKIDHSRGLLRENSSKRTIIEEDLKTLASKIRRNEQKSEIEMQKLAGLKADLEKPFDTELDKDELDELEKTSSQIYEIEEELNDSTTKFDKLGIQIQALNAELETRLFPKKNALEKKISAANSTKNIRGKDEIALLSTERSHLDNKRRDLEDNFENLIKSIAVLKDEKMKYEKDLEKANSQQRSLLKRLSNHQKDAEKAMVKKSALAIRRADLQQKMREVGLLAEESLHKFQALNSEALINKLGEINARLAKMTNVNKRASENYKRFEEKQKELVTRAAELEESKISIEELIKQLKQQKHSAVETTFKKVSDNFSTIFESLVPRGIGSLIINRFEKEESKQKTIKRKRNNRSSEATTDPNSENLYSGVSIKVSFNSKKNEQLKVEQLSGGQKTVCAIALILALQMVDPAPFYLFDEVDAALDKQYRIAVARTIKSLSAKAQFICTTFRTDMITVADKFYRVKFENKLSTVGEIARGDALDFIKGSKKLAEI